MNTEDALNIRLKEAMIEETASMGRQSKILVDPYTCEILNDCGISNDLIESHAEHMEYLKANNEVS